MNKATLTWNRNSAGQIQNNPITCKYLSTEVTPRSRMFQHWSSGTNPAVRQRPWAGEPVTAGPHTTAGSGPLAAAAWGNGDSKGCFSQKPLLQSPLDQTLATQTPYSLISNSSCRSLSHNPWYSKEHRARFCEELVCLGQKGWTQGLWCPRMLI